MNLIEESFQSKEEKKKKTISRIILGAIIFTVIIIISIVAYLLYIESTTLKLTLDGQSNESLKKILVIEEDGTIYVPIREVAKYFGYESYKGDYTEKSEDDNKCYVQNENEVANFTLGSNKIYKLDLTSETENYEYSYEQKPVKAIGGVLYATSEMIESAFNVSFQYDQEKNRITILTMPYLIQAYNSVVLDYGYSKISDVFANQKAILQNMLVVEKEDKTCGVIDVEGNAILEAKYDNITYLPNVGDFLVETKDKVGIMSKNKETKVQIMYDSIELMDSDAGLYIVKKDNKYGVIDLRGNIKIYIENDEIGVDISKFSQNNIKNKYILAGNLIPVRKDKLWALYDKSGNQLVDFKYDSFGYIASSSKDALNLLVIPDYEVLVACKDKKYTLLNSVGEELFAAPVADDIYMTISGGETHYYITANNGTMDAEVYLDRIGVTTKSSNNQNNTTSNSSSNSSINLTNDNNVSNNNPTNNQNTTEGNINNNIQGQNNQSNGEDTTYNQENSNNGELLQ